MAIAKLSIDLEARLANLQAGLDKAGLLAERQAERINGAFNGIARVGAGLGVALAGAFSAAGITAFVRSTVDGLDALNDFADATGTTIELASALEDVAARTGTSFETVQGAVLKLNKVLSDAKPGTEAANVLKLIGLNAEELKRLDPAEALRATAVALAGFADDGDKARITQELFGKSTAEVAPLLKDLAESGKLNATVTTEQAKQAEEFNRQLAGLQKNITDAARAITADMLPALNQYFERIARIRAQKGGSIFGQELVSEIQSVRLALATSKVEDLTVALRTDPSNRALAQALAAAREEYGLLSKAAADANERLKTTVGLGQKGGRPANEGGGRFLGISIGEPPKAPGKPSAKPLSLVGPMLDDATLNAIKALENTDVARISALREQLQSLISIRGSVSDTTRIDEALANTVDQLTKLDPAAQAAAASADKLKRILASTPSGQLASVLEDVELVNAALGNDEDYEKWAEAMRTVTSRLGSQTEAELDKVSGFAEQAGRNIQDALGTSLEQALTGNFESIGELWRNLLVRMAAQAAAAQLNSYLFGDTFGSKGGKLEGVVGSLFSAFSGLPSFAVGTDFVPRDMVAKVHKGERIVPAAQNRAGLGAVTINQTINVGQGVSRGEVYAAAMQAKDAAKAEILQTLYRTGRGAYA